MTARTFHQDFSGAPLILKGGFSTVGERIGDAWLSLGPWGRRSVVTGLGAVLALALGVAAAAIVRLPSETTDPIQPQDQNLAQSELPSEAAARAYALDHPPTYAVAAPSEEDAALPDASSTPDVAHDDEPGRVDDRASGDRRPAASTITPGDPGDPGDAG